MKTRNKNNRQTVLLAAIATIFLLGAFNSTFALESKTNINLVTLGEFNSTTIQTNNLESRKKLGRLSIQKSAFGNFA